MQMALWVVKHRKYTYLSVPFRFLFFPNFCFNSFFFFFFFFFFWFEGVHDEAKEKSRVVESIKAKERGKKEKKKRGRKEMESKKRDRLRNHAGKPRKRFGLQNAKKRAGRGRGKGRQEKESRIPNHESEKGGREVIF